MVTEVGCRVNVPVVSLLFSDSLIAVTFRATSEPAGITTRPELSFTSLAIFAMTVSPTLFLLERISPVVAAVRLVPAARLAGGVGGGGGGRGGGGGVDGAGAGVVGLEAVAGGVLGELVVGRMGLAGVLGAGAEVEVLAVGRSFSSAVVSTGAS